MTIDLYTKSMLTIIAAALLWICIKPVVAPSTVTAQSGPARVMLVDKNGKPSPQTVIIVNPDDGSQLPLVRTSTGGNALPVVTLPR